MSFTEFALIIGAAIGGSIVLFILFPTKFRNTNNYEEELRGVKDDKLPFVATSNLWLLALARLMEAQGANDQKLIDELRKRGRAEK